MPTILVVDDSAVDRKIAGGCVESINATPIFAENGRDAMERVKLHQPDLVVTDLKMPEMDGLELVKQLRHLHPSVPVVLMTAYGSEETAVSALRAGASSYVPKKKLAQDLPNTLRSVLEAAESVRDKQRVRGLLINSQSEFVLGYGQHEPGTLINHLQDDLNRIGFCDEADLIRIGTALTEAISNAIDHGNLELDSELREADDGSYRSLGLERIGQEPYCDRKVHVRAILTANRVEFTVRDEGSGFDPDELPDPTDPANLIKPSGRGVMLMRTFMDDVTFNERGNEITLIKKRSEMPTTEPAEA